MGLRGELTLRLGRDRLVSLGDENQDRDFQAGFPITSSSAEAAKRFKK